MDLIQQYLQASRVHSSWQSLLSDCLAEVDQAYLEALWFDTGWLPGRNNMLAAFRQDRNDLRYLLFGESPYPRAESSVGIAFLDGAVDELWSESGLSVAVNRATSLRNLMKTMLVADEMLTAEDVSQQSIAALDKSNLVKTIHELFANLSSAGFLMLNATPVLHRDRKPQQEARYWFDFNRQLLERIARDHDPDKITLVLWGKIAKVIRSYEISQAYRVLETEHPYNVSFIKNPQSLALFKAVAPLRKR